MLVEELLLRVFIEQSVGICANVRVPDVKGCWVGDSGGGGGSGLVRPGVMPWHGGHISTDAKALMSHGRSSRRSALIHDAVLIFDGILGHGDVGSAACTARVNMGTVIAEW